VMSLLGRRTCLYDLELVDLRALFFAGLARLVLKEDKASSSSGVGSRFLPSVHFRHIWSLANRESSLRIISSKRSIIDNSADVSPIYLTRASFFYSSLDSAVPALHHLLACLVLLPASHLFPIAIDRR
jgi:hypothetical protein